MSVTNELAEDMRKGEGEPLLQQFEIKDKAEKVWFRYTITGSSDVGDRNQNEDRYFFKCFFHNGKRVQMAAICDGHGGVNAAEYVKNNLFEKIMAKLNDNFPNMEVLIRSAFIDIHLEMYKNELYKWPKYKGYYPSIAGTTVSLIMLIDGRLVFAHVGDSPILFGCEMGDDGWEACRLSDNHTVHNLDEVQEVVGRGGKVRNSRVCWNHRVNIDNTSCIKSSGVLSITRALGSFWSYNRETREFTVSPVPKVGCVQLDSRIRCVVIVSDGVSNILPDEMIVKTFQNLDCYEMEASHNSKKNVFVNVPREIIERAKAM